MGVKCAQNEVAPKSEGSLGRPSLGLARASPRRKHTFPDGKALAVMAGCYAGAKGSMTPEPSTDSVADPSGGGISASGIDVRGSSGSKISGGMWTISRDANFVQMDCRTIGVARQIVGV